jgi:carboxypeptidase PM20D1
MTKNAGRKIRGILLVLLGLIAIVSFRTIKVSTHQRAGQPVTFLPVDASGAAERLSDAVKIQTISTDDALADPKTIAAFHLYLKQKFPAVHKALKREEINQGGLLYTWQGSDSSLNPALLMAHQDVVPVAPGTESLWKYSPFSGAIEDGYIWGRGAWDDKGNLLSILEATEALVQSGFHPKRTVYFAFGHDEETGPRGGAEGARKIAETLKSRGVKLDFVLDEGLLITDGIMKGLSEPLALIGVAEKGYVTVTLTATAKAGHSSMPPKITAIGSLSQALVKLEKERFPQKLTPVVRKMFETLAPESSMTNRIVFSNLWLFWPVLKKSLEKIQSADAMLRTTTALTVINAGNKENVLPGVAHASVNFRTLPGVRVDEVIQHVHKVIDDPSIEVQVSGNPREETLVSSTDSAGYHAIENAVRDVFPKVVISPGLLTATTDSYQFTDIAKDVYRFSPVMANAEDLERFHGTNERISIQNYTQMIQFYQRLLQGAGN